MSPEVPACTVAIVAPSGYPADPVLLERACAYLKSQGCEVRCLYENLQRFQRFGGSDVVRAEQLHAAAADPAVDIVLALRGGYGLSRLLPLLDMGALARSGKLFVGHSDFTALHMALLAAGAASFAGPMACPDFGPEEISSTAVDSFWACLHGPQHTLQFTTEPVLPLSISGTLWGGNLTMLAHLVGTPYLPHVDDGILFIEDVNEHPYRIERTLLQLLYAGRLNQKAIVFGNFSEYRIGEYDNGYDFAAMLDYVRQRTGVPVLTGLPFGHMRDKVTLAVGCQATLESDGRACRLTMSGYPTLDGRRDGPCAR